MHLKPGAKPLQNSDRFLLRGFAHGHRAESPRKRGIALDILSVFLQRCCADDLNFAAPERRLEEIRRVDCAFRRTCADDRMQLVDKQNDITASADLLDHVAHALFKFAAVFRPCEQACHVQRKQPLPAQQHRHVAFCHALRKPLHNRRFPNARLSDQRRVILALSAKDLHNRLRFRIAPDHRRHPIRQRDQIFAKLLRQLHRRFPLQYFKRIMLRPCAARSEKRFFPARFMLHADPSGREFARFPYNFKRSGKNFHCIL